MSKKNRRFEIDDLEPSLVTEAADEPQQPEIPKISFGHWFDKMLKTGKVRHYQDEALLVFFRKQGLKAEEIEDKYHRAFQNF